MLAPLTDGDPGNVVVGILRQRAVAQQHGARMIDVQLGSKGNRGLVIVRRRVDPVPDVAGDGAFVSVVLEQILTQRRSGRCDEVPGHTRQREIALDGIFGLKEVPHCHPDEDQDDLVERVQEQVELEEKEANIGGAWAQLEVELLTTEVGEDE